VLSPFTAMLVLESASDYARFGLDRRALADILTVGPGGLQTLARSRRSLQEADATTAEPTAPKSFVGRGARDETDDEDDRGVRDRLAQPRVPDPLVQTFAPAPAAGTVPGEAEGGLPGGTAGGVPGGVPGGVAGGVVAGVPGGEAGRTDGRSIVGVSPPSPAGNGDEARWSRTAPYSGRFAQVMADLAAGRVAAARTLAEAWTVEAPGDVLALVALGEAWEAAGEKAGAARAYGSLIDLFPSRADLRRLAGERLERLGDVGLELAIDSYEKAAGQRPDHPSGHRLLAWARWRAGRYAAAFEALERGLEQDYPSGRFPGVDRVLREDLGMLAAAWLRAEPGRRHEVLDRLRDHGARLATEPSLRFVLSWETDANDVDLHVYDRLGGHAYFEDRQLPSGGDLFADVTTGYGPECFAVSKPAGRRAAPYRLAVHYYSRGPMGYGMGTVQVVAHDGAGRLKLEPRPFVVMADNAWLDMGLVGDDKRRSHAGGRK
jgi:hypothetical protein